MGLEYSIMEMLKEAVKPHKKVTAPDGTITEEVRDRTVITLIVAGSFITLIALIDRGNGLFSKTFGWKCAHCSGLLTQ